MTEANGLLIPPVPSRYIAQVDDKYVRQLHHTSKGSHRSKQQQQLPPGQQQLQEKQQLTPPSSVTSQSSLYHGKVIAGTSASSGTAPGLKEFKAVAKGT